MLSLLVAALAGAAVPDGVTPVAAPVDVHAEHAAWRASAGLPTARLACDVLWVNQALLCFRVVERGRRRWVTDADLAAWGVDLSTLRRQITERASNRLAEGVVERRVEGMNASYLVVEDRSWAVAGALHPDALAERIGGGPVLVALPADGYLLAWKPGDEELDTVVAVAVKELHAQAAGAVTAVVHLWDGTRWRTFGEAVPSSRRTSPP